MKKILLAVVLAAVVIVGFGGLAGSAHAQTTTAPATLSASDLNVLGQTLSVFKNVLDEIQARLDAHAIPESSFSTLNTTLEGMKGSLLSIRATLAQSTEGSVPVATTPESAPISVSVESQPASQAQPVAVIPAENTNAAQQSASVGLIARHPTISLWVGLIVFVLIIGILLFVRTRSDGDQTEQKPKEPGPNVATQQTDVQ